MKRLLLFTFLFLSVTCFATGRNWIFVEKADIVTTDLNTNPHVLSNLTGDTFDYKLFIRQESLGSNIQLKLRVNGDTGSNYREYTLRGSNSTPAAGQDDAQTQLSLCGSGTESNYAFMSTTIISGTSGDERTLLTNINERFGTTPFMQLRCGWWQNTTDEINSLSIGGDSTNTVTAQVYLFKRRKDIAFQGNDWKLIDEKIASGTDLFINPFIFQNLNGDEDIEYLLEARLLSTFVEAVVVRFNGDSGTNYEHEQMTNNAGTDEASTSTASSIEIAQTDTGDQGSYTTSIISAQTGAFRTLVTSYCNPVTANLQAIKGNWWRNTADNINTLTVLTINGSVMTGYVRLYKRSQKRSPINTHWKFVERVTFAGDFSAGHIFKNLNGDTDGMYRLVISSYGSDANSGDIAVRFNGDSGSNYEYQHFGADGITEVAATATQTSLFTLHRNITDTRAFSEFIIFPESGKYRAILSQHFNDEGSSFRINKVCHWWQNTADVINNISVFNSLSDTITGEAVLYKLKLP